MPEKDFSMDINPNKYRNLLAIKSGHLLELADSKRTSAEAGERESHLFKELNDNQELVAHYRVWNHQSNRPPFRLQKGWEKYSPTGELLIREVRYSRLQEDDSVTLH